jgi:hypothetical protein
MDAVCTVGGNPGVTAQIRNFVPQSSFVTGENSSDGDFVTVVNKKTVRPSLVNPPAIANTIKKPTILMIGVRSTSSLYVVEKKIHRKSCFVSRISLEVTTTDVEKSLKDQLQLAFLTCTR